MFFGLLDPDPLVRGMDPDPSIIKKNLDSYCQCCGSGMFIPDHDFYLSRISDPGSKNSNKREG
jgi:hypothetical protein